MLIGLMTERQNVWQKRKSSLGSCLKTSNHCNCNSKNPNAKRLLLAYDKSVAHSAKIVTHGPQPVGKRVCWLVAQGSEQSTEDWWKSLGRKKAPVRGNEPIQLLV
jgi:hypothetical protein